MTECYEEGNTASGCGLSQFHFMFDENNWLTTEESSSHISDQLKNENKA